MTLWLFMISNIFDAANERPAKPLESLRNEKIWKLRDWKEALPVVLTVMVLQQVILNRAPRAHRQDPQSASCGLPCISSQLPLDTTTFHLPKATFLAVSVHISWQERDESDIFKIFAFAYSTEFRKV